MTAGNDWSGGNSYQSPPSNWSTTYTQFLSRSASHATKTLQLYQQVLECVAQGLLPATVFQDYFPRFTQTHGTTYTDRLTELGAQFLRTLVQVESGHVERPINADPETEIPAPIFETANPGRWFEQYAEYAGQLNARAVKAYRKQLDQVAVGEVTPEDVQRKTSGQMSQHLPDYLQRVGQLYLDMLDKLGEIRADYEEEYFRGLLALAKGRDKESTLTLVLSGPLGGMAFASFTISNTTTGRTPIHYMGTEVRRADGIGAAFAPKIVIDPEVLELGPGEDATISFSLELRKEQFDTEIPYVGFLYITGQGDLRVEMQLRIAATPVAGSVS